MKRFIAQASFIVSPVFVPASVGQSPPSGIGISDLGAQGLAITLVGDDGAMLAVNLDAAEADEFAGLVADALTGSSPSREVAND